jgi:antitoxin YefM
VASISATEARKRLYALIDEVGDWNAIQETLHLVSIPGMRESILDGLATPVADLSDQPGW